MDLRKLRYFLALAEELHFERAALRVGIDQPTFSRKIRELERDLHATLFARNNQGTRGITAAGNALLPWAQSIVMKMDQALRAVRDASSGITEQLRIGVCDDIPMKALAYVLSKYRVQEPRLDIQLIDRPCHTLIQDVQMGIVDLCLSLGQPRNADLLATPLWLDPAQVVLPDKHALAKRGSITLRDLAAERLMMGHRACGCGRRDEVDHALHSMTHQLQVKEAVNLTVLQTLVAAGHGVGIVSAAQAERICDAELVIQPIGDTALTYRTFILMRPSEVPSRVHQFVELAQEAAQRGT